MPCHLPWLTSSLLSPVVDPGGLMGMARCHCENHRRKPAHSQVLLTCRPEAPPCFLREGHAGWPLAHTSYIHVQCRSSICINYLYQECSVEEKHSYDLSKSQRSLKEQTVIKKKRKKRKVEKCQAPSSRKNQSIKCHSERPMGDISVYFPK